MLQHAATRCDTLLRAATRCNTLQHTAHTATLEDMGYEGFGLVGDVFLMVIPL